MLSIFLITLQCRIVSSEKYWLHNTNVGLAISPLMTCSLFCIIQAALNYGALYCCLRDYFLQLYLLWVMTYRGGKKVYEPPRFMTITTTISQLLEVEEGRGESGRSLRTCFLSKNPLRQTLANITTKVQNNILLHKYCQFIV